jgi:hypothetical protein
VTNDLARLPQMIERAIAALDKATTAAEVLDVQKQAGLAYTAAKAAAQFAKMKDAHDTVVEACRKMMGDALVIEARAQCRLADEYDAAQKAGDVVGSEGGNPNLPNRSKTGRLASVTDIGLTRKQVHAARKVRDAEKKKPGIVRLTVDEKLKTKEEPTRASINRVIEETIAPPKPVAQAPSVKPAVAPDKSASLDHTVLKAESTAPAEESELELDIPDDVDDAIGVLLDHLETLEGDEQMRFVDRVLLPIELASRRLEPRCPCPLC